MWFKNDFPLSYQQNFQMPATNNAEGIINLHNDMMFFLIFIVFFVGSFMLFSLVEYKYAISGKKIAFFPKLDLLFERAPLRFAQHVKGLEIIWTLIPSVILFSIGWPSLLLLYSLDEAVYSPIILKVIGHQWYWSYEYSFWTNKIKSLFLNSSSSLTFDSYMIPYDDLQTGDIRLLAVDNYVVLPTWINIRVLATSEDVIHSWAVPSLGVKVDAIPGRLNQIFFLIKRPGIFFGQCSEICGTNHGFMPIGVKAVYPENYLQWSENWLKNLNLLEINNQSISDVIDLPTPNNEILETLSLSDDIITDENEVLYSDDVIITDENEVLYSDEFVSAVENTNSTQTQ